MILEHGNIWDIYPITNLLLFTSNGVLTKDGKLVMGAGIAKQVRDRFPGIDKAIGEQLILQGHLLNKPYGLLLSPKGGKIGLFQTKIDWKDTSPIWLIEKSTDMLCDYAIEHPDKRIDMTFPAISNGGRTYEEILPIIEVLPNNVHIWTQE